MHPDPRAPQETEAPDEFAQAFFSEWQRQEANDTVCDGCGRRGCTNDCDPEARGDVHCADDFA